MRFTVLGIALLIGVVPPQSAQGANQEDFEGPQMSWRPAGSDARYQILDHRRVKDGGHSRPGCERISLATGNGTKILFSHPVPPASVIDELVASVWVKSDRPGVRILARVVLPRTNDPQSGRPITTLIAGSNSQPGTSWQQLRVENIPFLLARRVRGLRKQYGPEIDPRETYVDQVLLDLFCGPGSTTVTIDDMLIKPAVEPRTRANIGERQVDHTATSQHAPYPELQGSTLTVAGKTVLPRVIQHQSEPLVALQELGFNAVGTSSLPTPDLLREAARVGLWLICPPPAQDQLRENAIGPQYDPVLAWDLGAILSGGDLKAIQELTRQLVRSDPRSGRPTLGYAETELRAFSRELDILIIGRDPLSTHFELGDYFTWLKQRSNLALAGTPIWTRIQTQPHPQLWDQWRTFSQNEMVNADVDVAQIEMLCWMALATGARGLWFDSHSPLTAPDPTTRHRARALELINLQLRLVEPWAARGSVVAAVPSSQTDVTGAVLRVPTQGVRLLIPLDWKRGEQIVSGPANGEKVSFVVPGVPESNDAYELTPCGWRQLAHQRVAGGFRVVLEPLGTRAMVVMTQDPRVISRLAKRIDRFGPRASHVIRELAIQKADLVGRVSSAVASRTNHAQHATALQSAARAHLQQCDSLLLAGQYARAYRKARGAMSILDQVQRILWEQVSLPGDSSVSSPFALNFTTLPLHWELVDRLRRSHLGANQLPGGDFEELAAARAAGWQHLQHPVKGVLTRVDLSSTEPRTGQFCLRIRAVAENDQSPPHLVVTTPVWVVSPPVAVSEGQWLRIHGWVRVSKPIAGSVDGLQIIDSLGRLPLAERIGQTRGWKEFTLYRAATQQGSLTVTFALSGLGEAEIDGVTIEPIVGWQGSPPQRQASGDVLSLPNVR